MIRLRRLTLSLFTLVAVLPAVAADPAVGATLRGTVREYTQRSGLSGVKVWVTSEAGKELARTNTNASGAYEIPNLSETAVTVFFRRDDCTKKPTARAVKLDADVKTVDVEMRRQDPGEGTLQYGAKTAEQMIARTDQQKGRVPDEWRAMLRDGASLSIQVACAKALLKERPAVAKDIPVLATLARLEVERAKDVERPIRRFIDDRAKLPPVADLAKTLSNDFPAQQFVVRAAAAELTAIEADRERFSAALRDLQSAWQSTAIERALANINDGKPDADVDERGQ